MVVELEDNLCIAISGIHGSGTSTAAKQLSEYLGLKLVSAGAVFRESAKKRGYKDVSNFIEIVEGNPELKEELDATIRLEAESGNVIVEGRIVCWTAKEFAHLRVMLDAPPKVRVPRISKRSGVALEEAEKETRQRELEEKQWFLANRNIDLDDKSVFDLIINTDRLAPSQVVQIISAAISSIMSS
jgi:cytidylate kinase